MRERERGGGWGGAGGTGGGGDGGEEYKLFKKDIERKQKFQKVLNFYFSSFTLWFLNLSQ